jgi:hypothetical protein
MKAVITNHPAKNAQRLRKIILPSALQIIVKKDGKDKQLKTLIDRIMTVFNEIFAALMRYTVLFRKFVPP